MWYIQGPSARLGNIDQIDVPSPQIFLLQILYVAWEQFRYQKRLLAQLTDPEEDPSQQFL